MINIYLFISQALTYLTRPEGDAIVILRRLFVFPIIQLFSPYADGHRTQVLIHPEVVLVLWGLTTGRKGRYEVRVKKQR